MSATLTPHYFGSTSFGALAGLPFPAVPAVPAMSGGAGAIRIANPFGWQWLFSAGPIPSTPARITLHPFRAVQFGALAGLPWPVAAGPLAPDLLAALYSYLTTAPTVIPLFSVGFGAGGFGSAGYGGSVKVWYEVADASAYPPFLTIHGYTEPLPGESLEDQEILVSLLITTNSIDEARTIGRAVRDAIDTPNQSPTSLGRPPFTFTGGVETGLMRDASNPERRSGYGKGGTFVYVEQIDYRIWVSPEQ